MNGTIADSAIVPKLKASSSYRFFIIIFSSGAFSAKALVVCVEAFFFDKTSFCVTRIGVSKNKILPSNEVMPEA